MISDKLKRVILESLELEDWDLEDGTTASEVPGWDSLSHARIIASVEAAYHVRFEAREILRLQTLGQLQALVDRKAT